MVVDRVDQDTERRQAELVNAFSQPASVYFAKQALHPADSISKAVETISGKNGLSVPVLDMPEDAGPDAVARGLKDMKDLLPGNIDDLVHGLFVSVEENMTEHLAIKREFFKMERANSEQKEQERTEEMKKQLSLSESTSSWKNVEKSIVSLGLIAAGIAGISIGQLPLGIAAVSIGTLMIVDQLLDDKAKKTVAGWLARGDKESEKMWVDRMHLFCAATSMALSFGLGVPLATEYGMSVAAKYAVQVGLTVAKTGASSVKTVYEWLHSNQKALMIELDAVCLMAQKKVDRLILEVQDMCNTLYQLYENMHHVEEKRDKLSRQMMQLPS